MPRPRLLHRIGRALIFVAALLLVFEEWLWRTLTALLHRLSGLAAVRAFEGWMRRLGPTASLAALLSPALVLLPFKLGGMWALAAGHPAFGLIIIVGAKLAGTACAAYVLDLVGDNARKVRWFDRLYGFVASWVARAKAWLAAQPATVRARAVAARLRARWRELAASLRRRGRWGRKVRVVADRVKTPRE